MKLETLKLEIKKIIQERSINAIAKLQQKNIENISKALEFYKKNKHTDKKEAFIKVLKKLGVEKANLAGELDLQVSAKYRDAEYKGESISKNESVNEAKKFSVKKLRDDYYPYGLYYDNRLVSGLKSNSKKEVENAIKSISKAMGIKESVNEGKKRYYQQNRVGSAKYTISYHDGKQKHKDGSDFFGIQIFKNKKDLAKFVNTLHKGGYVYGFNESEDGVPQGFKNK